jgi:YidC/Oxa1 family membrane protein insertase
MLIISFPHNPTTKVVDLNFFENLVDFGWFTIIAKPLLWFLKLTNKITGNFGIDIIILSILIKIIFLPLTQISMKSMKEMQKVQPEMNRLKEAYKDDKARLQQRIHKILPCD